jgi:hypothetical protein
MLDVGVFGCQFRSLEPQHVGMRMEDPYLIDADGRLRKLTDLPVRVWKERA